MTANRNPLEWAKEMQRAIERTRHRGPRQMSDRLSESLIAMSDALEPFVAVSEIFDGEKGRRLYACSDGHRQAKLMTDDFHRAAAALSLAKGEVEEETLREAVDRIRALNIEWPEDPLGELRELEEKTDEPP